MRFTVERGSFAGICRNLARIAPDTSPVADLTGILFEADENTGILNLTANNMEIAIQYRYRAIIEEGGKMVLNAKLISNMIPIFAGDRIVFNTQSNGVVHIQSERASFHISCLPGTHYPKPEMPEPESLVILTGLRTLARQTAFAARKPGNDAGVYSSVRLEVYPTESRMIATDTVRLAVARHRQVSQGQTVLLIPASSLSALAGIAGDGKVEAGAAGNFLIFNGPDFVFMSRTMAGEYMDVNEILKNIQPKYDALVPARDLRFGVDSLGIVADGSALMRLVLRDAGISLSYEGENSGFSTMTEAVVYRPTPETGFYYGVNGFLQALRYMEGNIRLMIDKNGMILLKNEDQCYLFSPVRPRKATAKNPVETGAGKKKKATKTKAAKAA